MNRVIKFRAWDTVKHEWFTPTYEAYRGKLRDLSITLNGEILGRTMTSVADMTGEFKRNFVLSQFTGLLDKNGKEIYEGDVLESVGASYIHRDTLSFGYANGPTSQRTYGYFWSASQNALSDVDDVPGRYEVVGNLYENPNLLQHE